MTEFYGDLLDLRSAPDRPVTGAVHRGGNIHRPIAAPGGLRLLPAYASRGSTMRVRGLDNKRPLPKQGPFEECRLPRP